jgi:hypothetical protein
MTMGKEQRLEYEILNYLIKQPAAKDTFQGIARWWVLKERIDYAIEKVGKVLNLLVSKRFLEIKHHQDGSKYYQINKDKMVEIEKELKELSKELCQESS